jgi:hypothetical protein
MKMGEWDVDTIMDTIMDALIEDYFISYDA